jgi:hypothetical protein
MTNAPNLTYGVDFSGAKDAGKKIWVARGVQEGEHAMERLREPSTIAGVASLAASFMLNGTRPVLGRFRPGEDVSRWYKREVRERTLQVTQDLGEGWEAGGIQDAGDLA